MALERVMTAVVVSFIELLQTKKMRDGVNNFEFTCAVFGVGLSFPAAQSGFCKVKITAAEIFCCCMRLFKGCWSLFKK